MPSESLAILTAPLFRNERAEVAVLFSRSEFPLAALRAALPRRVANSGSPRKLRKLGSLREGSRTPQPPPNRDACNASSPSPETLLATAQCAFRPRESAGALSAERASLHGAVRARSPRFGGNPK